MRTTQALLRDNVLVLRQGLDALAGIDDATYASPIPALGLAGIGPHVRHVLDSYERLFDGLETGRLDYDARLRDERVERDVDEGRARIRAVIERLERTLETPPRTSIQVRQDATGGSPDESWWTQSSVQRELAFVLSHTVHHYALIAVVLRSVGLPVDQEFGVAPSTLRYWEEQRACAR